MYVNVYVVIVFNCTAFAIEIDREVRPGLAGIAAELIDRPGLPLSLRIRYRICLRIRLKDRIRVRLMCEPESGEIYVYVIVYIYIYRLTYT